MEWIKVKAKQELNFGHLPGMPAGELAVLRKGDIMELPDISIVRFYIQHGSLEVIEEKEERIVKDEPEKEKMVKDIPKKENKKVK